MFSLKNIRKNSKRINNTRVIPLESKILFLFVVFILVSNFATNYINLSLNSSEMIKLMKELLVKDLKELYTYANSQYEIYQFGHDRDKTLGNIEKMALGDFTNDKAIALGVNEDGSFLFQAAKIARQPDFSDIKILKKMNADKKENHNEGFIIFKYKKNSLIGGDYFGVYKYNQSWGCYIIRAEEFIEFYKNSWITFAWIIGVILLITFLSTLIGIYLIRYLVRFVNIISTNIKHMFENQRLDLIDLKGASNDDVTYLGAAFNSLSNTINNLMSIFLKFVNKDIAQKAYRERQIALEGSKKDLVVLFSDIRGFTFMTETLGIDIIKLLNIHYDSVINEIIQHDGIIGSIIGDALLAVFGSIEDVSANKSFQAITAAYEVQNLVSRLRMGMHKIREDIEKSQGSLNAAEKKVYRAVLIEIGIGIDGGEVFYGNIGSNIRMTNTVIGDNVNYASRLEGLTKYYKVPVICSEYIKDDVENNVENHGIMFIEIDRVQVKGKTTGKPIFWPVFINQIDRGMERQISLFNEALLLYYNGNWNGATRKFKLCKLPVAEIFIGRTAGYKKPNNWKGIWTMETK